MGSGLALGACHLKEDRTSQEQGTRRTCERREGGHRRQG